jgi:RNA polymerase sigma-70 factor (ECF subfamily)
VAEAPFDDLLRIEGGRVLATLIRLTGDIGLAEDAVQDALVVAVERWPRDGVPENPAAWLTTTARNRALDRLRREASRSHREAAAVDLLDASSPANVEHVVADAGNGVADDELRLLFTCCHPALAAEVHVPLALRTLCGLSTVEIARAYLVPEATMGQRISRAKRKIATARIPYRVPEDHELPDRLASVLAAIYVMFTIGHHAADGRLDARVDLADEAIRLARAVDELMGDEPECQGLLALLLATHARRATRVDGAGDVVLLAHQDRQHWDHEMIAEAAGRVEAALRRRDPGQFQIQAAIATLHGLAPSFAETDWPQIAELYGLLEQCAPTPVVRVNRAVAVAEVAGVPAALALLDGAVASDPAALERWHLYWSTRADLLRRDGRVDEAVGAYVRALGCPMNDADRRFLTRRSAELAPHDVGA